MRLTGHAEALFAEAARLWRITSQRSEYRTARLPDADEFENDIERVALAVRHMDGLEEDAPIRNVTRLLERHGIAVIDGLDPDFPDGYENSGISRPSAFEDRPLVATGVPSALISAWTGIEEPGAGAMNDAKVISLDAYRR